MKILTKKMVALLFFLPTFLMAASPFEKSIWVSYLEGIGWAIAASIGFSIGVAIAIKVFDWFSSDIDEWEEIKDRKSVV